MELNYKLKSAGRGMFVTSHGCSCRDEHKGAVGAQPIQGVITTVRARGP